MYLKARQAFTLIEIVIAIAVLGIIISVVAVSANIGVTNYLEAINQNTEMVNHPLMTSITPVGTVIYGPLPEQEQFDKRLKLDIYYTETDR